MKRSASADRASTRPTIEPFNNVRPARPTLVRSSSYDVHCGCQFYGTDSLLPERRAMMLAGRPLGRLPPATAPASPLGSCSLVPNRPGVMRSAAVIRSASAAPRCRDHEYEPVSPRSPPQVLVSGPYDRYEPELGMAPKREGSNESHDLLKKERKFFHDDSLDDEMTYTRRPVKDNDFSEDEAIGYDSRGNRDARAQSPCSTTGSRTDMELNTSQVDSSALEDLPLSRDARRKAKLEKSEERGPGAAARSMQSIRNQAGRLKAKMKAMKRPKINLPERPKFNMPERPKFTMPDRPKFNLPDRPKFKLPERPKFNLPDRPKFNFPDRPKFNMPDRPKFNFPDRSKFTFTLPRTRKAMSERNQQDGEEGSVHVDTPMVDTPSKRSYFDFRNTYPRIFDRKNRNRRELDISAPVQIRPRHVTPPTMRYEDDDEDMDEEPVKPSLPPRRKTSQDSSNKNRWGSKLSDLDYMDEEQLAEYIKNGSAIPFDDEEEDEEIRFLKKELNRQHSGESDLECSETLSGFRDKDFGYALTFNPGNNQAMEIVQRRQQEVLAQQRAPTMDEEDISLPGSDQEAAHSSGSSSDRRRTGVLEEISSDEFFLREKGVSQEDVDVERYLTREIKETFRPTTNNGIEQRSMQEPELARSYRGTPERVSPNTKNRPARRTRNAPKPPARPATPKSITPPPPVYEPIENTEPIEPSEEEERKVVKGDTTWYFNTFPPNKPNREKRRQLRQKSSTINRKATNQPQAPQRKSKRTRSEFVLDDNTSQWSVDPDQEWLKNLESNIEPTQVEEQPSEPDYIIPETGTPAPPKRGRKQSMQSRKTDDDARSYISFVSRASDALEEPGYAYVVKPGVISYEQPTVTPPPRRYKTLNLRGQYPTAAKRRRGRPLSGSGTSHFHTMPHRKAPPVRPSRNYATLGPARPPRRARRASLEDVRNESLQSGAVIQKMKERPLPAPPRPPRKEREQEEVEALISESTTITESFQQALSEPVDIIRSPMTDEPAPKKEETPPTEHILHANLTVSSAEVVMKQEEVKENVQQAPQLPERNRTSVEAQSHTKAAPQISTSQSSAVESLPVEELQNSSDPKPTITVKSKAPSPPQVEVDIPQQIVTALESTPVISARQEVPECVAPASVSYSQETPIQPPTSSEPLQTSSEVQAIIEQEQVVQSDNIPRVSENEVCVPVVYKRTEQISEQKPVETIPAPVDVHPSSSVEIQTSFDAAETTDVATATLVTEAICDVTVSTQTDPLPEDELIEDSVPVETEDYVQSAPVVPQSAPVPSATSYSDISPAARALLEAINSGQLRLDLLDVGSLRVSELQAQRMLVSNVDGVTMNIADLHSQSGTLALSSVQAPMDNLAEALLAAAQRMLPPPPPPQIIHVPAAAPPHSDMQCQTTPKSSPKTTPLQRSVDEPSVELTYLEAETTQQRSESVARSLSPMPTSSPVFTTEQVLALQAAAMSTMVRSRSRERSQSPGRSSRAHYSQDAAAPVPYFYQQHRQSDVDPGIIELGNRLARACCSATLSALRRIVSYTEQQADNMADETRQRSGLQLALCFVLVIVAGIILVASLGGNAAPTQKHHWDFYLPQ